MAGLVETFHAFSGILVICPCCGELLRLSELRLRYTGKFERTVLDDLREKQRAVQKKEEALGRRRDRFNAEERELRNQAAERGRRKVKRLVRRLDPDIKKLRYHPQDIKVILHPVDLIVFDGLNDGERVKNVILIARSQPRNTKTIRNSIEKALDEGRYVWETVRVGIDGGVSVSNT